MPTREERLSDLPPYDDRRRGERLQRVMADAGIAARRDCEAMILAGRVSINGERVSGLPIWVHPELDHIEVDGRPVSTKPERLIYIMLNKPSRVLTAAEDEPGAARVTVTELVQHPSGARLFPVGRLDFDTTGLLILTNDGELANRLTHPRFGVSKTYLAVVKGRVADEAIQSLEEGIYLAERQYGRTVGAVRTARVRVEIHSRDKERTVLAITLKEGRNRQVRRMLSFVGHPIKKLERVAMGPVTLTGLARGHWRELTREEVRALKQAVKPGARSAPAPRVKARFKTGPRRPDGKAVAPARPQGAPAAARPAIRAPRPTGSRGPAGPTGAPAARKPASRTAARGPARNPARGPAESRKGPPPSRGQSSRGKQSRGKPKGPRA